MKKILIALFTVCLAITGCDLTTLPESSLVPENYFSSAASLEQWLNNCYTQLENYGIAEMEDDNVLDNSPTAFFGRTRLPATESWGWGMLRRINYLIENAHYCEDKQAVEYYTGLARFHRAYFYFEKLRKYGDIMWYDKVLGSTDEDLLYKPRDDRGYVMDRIIEDFDAAAAVLKDENNAYSSEITKWVALAFKARACLFEGTFRKYHGIDDGAKYLEECVDACQQIMESGKFSLYSEGNTPYQDLFSSDPAPKCETILARVYNSNLSLYHSITRDALSSRQGMTQRLVNHYLTATGSYISSVSGYEKQGFTEVFKDRDPRMKQTVWGPGCKDRSGNVLAEAYNLKSLTGYYPLKYAVNVKETTNRGEDIILFRYAEILLDFAEAKAELGTLNATDAVHSIDLLRTRAGMPAFKVNPTLDPLMRSYYPNVQKVNPSNEALILEIRRERTVELVMEGRRQWDLIRWCEGAAIDNSKNPFYGVYIPAPGLIDLNGDGSVDVELYGLGTEKTGKAPIAYELNVEIFLSGGTFGNVVALKENNYVFNEERDYLWPIPAAQRALCNGTLSQNPGWDDGLDF